MADINERFKEMFRAFSKKGPNPGGVNKLLQILNQVDRQTEQHLLHELDRQNPSLAQEVRGKFFTFEDMVHIEDKVLKKALSEVHRSTLALALKGTTPTLQDKIFCNLSKHAVQLIKEDMDLMGPKPRSLVEEAQREVTKTVRRWKNVIL